MIWEVQGLGIDGDLRITRNSTEMSGSTDSIQQQIAALRRGFVEQLPERLAKLDAAHEAWCNGGAAELNEYHRLVHSLTGAGATFGCDGISQMARQLENHLKQLSDAGGEVAMEQFADAARLLDKVRAEVGRVDQSALLMADDVDEELPLRPSSRLVYLLANEVTRQSNIGSQLQDFGYQIERFSNGATLQQAIAAQRPAIILADVVLAEGERAGVESVAAIQRQQTEPLPVIFFSNDADFDVRLAVVRANGVAYFPHPLSVSKLVDVMDSLVESETSEPLRVLLVDDQIDQASHYALILQRAGIVTEVVTDSMRVFDVLAEFAPELILMDMYMPRCSGVELAAVIRQQPGYVGVPIVFLSTESERNVQLDAMRKGGDDFLTKPIKAGELIQSVTICAERYRKLRSLMSRDSLTGLLNHTNIMANLDGEVARTSRNGEPLSFAMLDIDDFKKINDDYGHAVGDSVLKSLSRLLLQRLRKSDSVGRYGGEEFAVIMPETSLLNATEVMNEVRQQFSEVVHCAGDREFSVTFSCGVAELASMAGSGELRELADQRLYRAKREGRNRIISNNT